MNALTNQELEALMLSFRATSHALSKTLMDREQDEETKDAAWDILDSLRSALRSIRQDEWFGHLEEVRYLDQYMGDALEAYTTEKAKKYIGAEMS